MFKQRTTFVIGAGASYEFNLPLGEGLKKLIVDALPTRRRGYEGSRLQQALLYKFRAADMATVFEAYDQIRQALPMYTSIDLFMDSFEDNPLVVEISKIAIAACIIQAEKNSKLYRPHQEPFDVNGTDKTWLYALYKLMQDGAKRTQLKDVIKNVTFVIFNYDRCIEHFLYRAIQVANMCDEKNAADALLDLKIIHPYGRVGRLPWERTDTDEVTVPFGDYDNITPDNLVGVAENIRTFTEQIEEDNSTMLAARSAMQETDKVAFIGFSYLDQNMAYLTPALRTQAEYAYGTTFGLSQEDQRIGLNLIQRVLTGSGGERIYFSPTPVDQTGFDFMQDWGNSLRR